MVVPLFLRICSIAAENASSIGCIVSRFNFNAAWLMTSRAEIGMISSTALRWLAFSVFPLETRSTIASANPTSGASSIEP